jgi:hypothetical protein
MKRLATFLFATAAAAALVACAGGGDGDKTFFEVDSADDAAHAAMFEPSDLPGSGWEVTDRDAAEDDSGADTGEAAKKEPSCSKFVSIVALSEPGSLFGEADRMGRLGRAQVELTKKNAAQILPITADLEVEILPTVSEVEDDWKPVKEVLDSEAFANCMAKLIVNQFESDSSLNGVDIKLVPSRASAVAPQDGRSVAFALTLSVPDVMSVEAQMEMYFWPYANAKNSVQIMGEKSVVTKSLVEDILKAADAKVVQAEKDY